MYLYDPNLYDVLKDRIHLAFKRLRESDLQKGSLTSTHHQDMRFEIESNLGEVHVSKETFQWLLRQKFDSRIENDLIENLNRWGNLKISEDSIRSKSPGVKLVALRVVEQGLKAEG